MTTATPSVASSPTPTGRSRSVASDATTDSRLATPDSPSFTITDQLLRTNEDAYFTLSDLEMRLLDQADLRLISNVAVLVPEHLCETLAAIREQLVHHHREPSWRVPTARQVIDIFSHLADRGLILMSIIGVEGSLFVVVAPIGAQLDLVRRSADLINLPAA